jgi:hypothetical protein
MIPTPREKAQELIDFYYQFIEQDSEWAMIQNSKLCTRRLIQELLASTSIQIQVEYWLQVNLAVDEISYIETHHPR